MSRSVLRKLMEIYGYEKLFPPQELAVKEGLLDGKNLLLATPTASGKTFIAALAIASRLLEGGGKAYYLVPLRSIGFEKYEYLSKLSRLGLKTQLIVGDTMRGPWDAEITIATYEKLDAIARSSPEKVRNASVVVIDEIHYLGDAKRGPVLESLLANTILEGESQILALSATVPNAEEIASWLNAKPLISDWRPVPLRESVYKDGKLYYPREGIEEEIPSSTNSTPYLGVLKHKLSSGGQAIVFSQSRRRTVQLAKRTAKSGLPNYDRRLAREYASKIMDSGGPRLVRELLAELVAKGVAFHHAGLGSQQRKLIEDAFREGAISVIHATPTLAAGVNLPARYVLVEEYYRFDEGMRKPIPVFEYKQLAGRAGRPGLDRVGEAIIIASPSDSPGEVAGYYILGDVEPVESKLSAPRGLRHFLLGAIVARRRASRDSLERTISRTLYAFQAGAQRILRVAGRVLRDLEEWGIVLENNGSLEPTLLGEELAKLYMDPMTVSTVRRLKARIRDFDETQALYIIASAPDMVLLPPGGRKEQERLLDTIIERYPLLVDLMDWFGPSEARIAKTMIALDLWINEASEDSIYEQLGVGAGDLYVLVETGSWIARSLARLSPHLGFNAREQGVFKLLEQRIRYGVKQELLPLVVIPGVGRVRARRLYEAGYKMLADLATASPQDLLRVKGVGPSIVRAILEFLGRREEAKSLESKGEGRRGLEAFF